MMVNHNVVAFRQVQMNRKKGDEWQLEIKSQKLGKNEKVIQDKMDSQKSVEKVTYDKPMYVPDDKAIDKLWEESQAAHQQLKDIVRALLERQGVSTEQIDKMESLEVDETAKIELEAMIGPDGELGVEKVSDRIVDFAIALSGGDTSKAALLKDAIIQGFKAAEEALGGLPDISRQTYDRVMEKFDAWVDGRNKEAE